MESLTRPALRTPQQHDDLDHALLHSARLRERSPLLREGSPVDDQLAAGHVRRVVGCEIEHGGHDLGHRSHASDRKSTRLNSSHLVISYAVFCLKKKKTKQNKSNLSR